MADWAKIALKTALIAGIMTALWGVFNLIQIPTIDFTVLTANSTFAYAFLTYWCPAFPVVWGVILTMLGVLLALWAFRFATVSVRWLFKVNE